MLTIYEVLDSLHISYVIHEHPAVFTVADAEQYDMAFEAGKTKNLFLRNKKADVYYLVVVQSTKRVDLKKLATDLGETKLSFGSEEKMLAYLGVTPGAVSPFGLIRDTEHRLQVIIDQDILQEDNVGFHPLVNTATLVISVAEFKQFLSSTGNQISYLVI